MATEAAQQGAAEPERHRCHVAVTDRVQAIADVDQRVDSFAGGVFERRHERAQNAEPAATCSSPVTSAMWAAAIRWRSNALHVEVDHRQLEMHTPCGGGRRVVDAGEDRRGEIGRDGREPNPDRGQTPDATSPYSTSVALRSR